MLSGVIASAMAVSLLSAGTFAQGKVSKAAEKEIVYHAALGIQTAGDNNKQDEAIWMNRFGYFGKIGASGSKNL